MDRQCKKNNRQFTYGQTVQKKQQTIYLWTDSAKKQQTIYIWTDSAKKTTDNLPMDRQCKKNNRQFTYGQTVQKKQQTIYIWTDSAKKTTDDLHMDRQCKKNCTGAFTVLQTVQKNTTTAIYIWTVHIYRLYRRQCAKYTYIYSVHIVYYKDILNYQRHIIHHMGTSALCTVSIHEWTDLFWGSRGSALCVCGVISLEPSIKGVELVR